MHSHAQNVFPFRTRPHRPVIDSVEAIRQEFGPLNFCKKLTGRQEKMAAPAWSGLSGGVWATRGAKSTGKKYASASVVPSYALPLCIQLTTVRSTDE
jgi:hypothetical protein